MPAIRLRMPDVRRLLTKRLVLQIAFGFGAAVFAGGTLRADEIEPTLRGEELRGALRRSYMPQRSLGYRGAREQMFGHVDNDGGDVRLHYAGTTLRTSTIPNGSLVNTEHTWPQSKFRDARDREKLKSDLHHLFPTYSSVNAARGSWPFAEIADTETTKWWRDRDFARGIPEDDIDAYSESTSRAFEPRESDKGNVARAMFYFYVMYEDHGINLGWFHPQESTLLDWHRADPADPREVERSHRIAALQGNENPFVLDPSLAERILQPHDTDDDSEHDALSPRSLAASTEPRAVARPATRGRAPEGCPSTEPLDAHVFGVSSEQDVMYAHIVDVGQGNAALLEFPCGAMLIDAGGQNDATTERLLDYLDEFFARRDDLRNTLEGIIITHNHVDHTRALREVVERFNVLRVIENGARGKSRDMGDTDVKWVNTRADETGSPQVTDVDDAQIDGQSGYTDNKIDPLQCPGTDPLITIMSADIAANPGWPRRDFVDKNNHSVVVRVDYGAASLLFTGDLEEPAIETMVDFYDGTSALDVDVYHVGHHGSHNGTTESLMRAMSPRLALISMSEWSDHDAWTAWEYGHPREEAVDLLKENVSCFRVAKNVRVAQDQRAFESQNMRRAIYATGWDGTIVVRATAQAEYTVETSE